MADNTAIEWTDATWNPIRGCSRVSEGCRHCYAETVANRFKGPGQPYEGLIAKGGQWNGQIKVVDSVMDQPLRWQKPRRIFVNSMSDLFHESVPFEVIAQIFAIMGVTTRHTYQVLTKRPARMVEFFRWALTRTDEDGQEYQVTPTDFGADERIFDHWPKHVPWQGYDNCGPAFPYRNVWLGVSVENQAAADERIPLLLQTPAAVRWISAEPLLGAVRVDRLKEQEGGQHVNALKGVTEGFYTSYKFNSRIDWVVVGGESGAGARPMHPDWARSLRDQCVDAGVPFLFKQWGSWEVADLSKHRDWFIVDTSGGYDIPDNRLPREQHGEVAMRPASKKAAGRQLDGQTWDQYPKGGGQ